MLLLAAQFAGYPLLVALVWMWLGIGERSALDLSLSLLTGILIVALLAWLLASAFNGSLTVYRKLPSAVLFVIAMLAALGAIWWLWAYNAQATDWIAVRVSNARGSAINPRRAAWVYPALLWTFAIAVSAIALPPLLAGSARLWKNWRYWTAWVALVIAGWFLPSLIVSWVPKLTSLPAQTASMVIRFLLAYAIALASFLGFAKLVRQMAVRRMAATPSEPSPAS